MSQDKAYDNLLSYLDEFYPDESQTQSLTFSNYPHLQKIADLMTELLHESEHRKMKKGEIQLVIRACSTLINENNDISVSEIQTKRVVKRKQLAYDSEFDDPEVMREKIADLHEQIAVYSTEMKNHQNQVDSLREEIAELRDENDNLQRKFNELKRTREDEVSKLTVQKEGIGDQYKTAMLDLKLETDKGLNLSAQIDNMMKETNEKDEDIEKLQQKNKEQKDLLRKAKSLLKTLESRITEDKATINRLNNQIKSLKSRSPSAKKVEKENLTLKKKNNLLRERMFELTDTNEKNLQTITELINENQRISQSLNNQRENDELNNNQRDDDNSNQENQSNKSDKRKSTQKNSTPKQSNNYQSKSPTNNRNCSNLSDFVENSSSTFNDAFESSNKQNSVTNKSENNDNNNDIKSRNADNKNNDNDDNNKTQEMEQSLKKIANLFKKSNIRPSQLLTIGQTIRDQEKLLNKFRSTIDAQARFITRLINDDYAAPYLLSRTDTNKNEDSNQNEEENENEEENKNEETNNNNNDTKEYPTASIFKDEKIKDFVLKAVEDTRKVAYEQLNDSDAEFNEIVLYDSIFDPEEGADLFIAEQESRGADNELAAVAILLSIIIKQRKIGESDAKFLQSIYKNMSLDFDHPASAEDAKNYINDIHQSIKKLRKFYNSEYERIDPEKDNAEFLTTFTTGINEFAPAIKESAGYKGKLIDLPDYLTSLSNRNAQNRSVSLNESGNNSTKQRNISRSSARSNNNNAKNNKENANNEEDYDEAVDLNSFTSPENSNEEEATTSFDKKRNISNSNNNTQNEEDDDSIFGERINSVPAGNSSNSTVNNNNDAKVRKLREEINNYKNEIKKLTQQLDDANTTSEVLQETFKQIYRKNEETEKNALVIISERDRLQNLLEERDKQFDRRIKNATSHIENQKDQEMKILKKRYEDENKLLAQKVDSRDKRMHEIKKSMKEIIGMYEDLLSRQREEIRELSKKNEEVEVEADEYIQKDDENEKKIDKLQNSIRKLLKERSNELSLSVTSANNSISIDNANTQSAKRSNTTNRAYNKPNGNYTYNSNYNRANNNYSTNTNNNASTRQNYNYNNKNFSPTNVNRNYNQNNNLDNRNYSFNNNNLSLNSSNRNNNNNNSGTSF